MIFATTHDLMIHPHYHTPEGHVALTRWTEAALKRITVPHERRYLPTRYGERRTPSWRAVPGRPW